MKNPPLRFLPLTIAATSLGFVVVQVDVLIVNTALVEIGNSLDANVSSLQWIVDAYVLVYASLLISSGALGDQFGSRRMFLWGFGFFSMASLVCGVAQTTTHLIVFRALQGLGAALIIPNALALLNHACAGSSSARAFAFGLWNTVGGLATAASPIIGGILIDLIGWRSIFLVNIPIGFLGIWLTSRFVYNRSEPSAHSYIDLPGQLLVIISLFSLITSIISAGTVGWIDWQVISGLLLALIAGYTFIWVETKSQNPMLPLRFFRNTRFLASLITGFLNNFTYYGLIFILSIFFQNILHYSVLQAALAFIPLTGGATISNLIGSFIAARSGPRLPMILGFLIAAAGYGSLYNIAEATHYLIMLFPFILIPFGLGLAIPPMTTALLSTVDQKCSGIASAVFMSMRQIGGAIGVAVFGTLINEHVSANVRGVQIIFIICACLSLIAAGISAIWVGHFLDDKARAF